MQLQQSLTDGWPQVVSPGRTHIMEGSFMKVSCLWWGINKYKEKVKGNRGGGDILQITKRTLKFSSMLFP